MLQFPAAEFNDCACINCVMEENQNLEPPQPSKNRRLLPLLLLIIILALGGYFRFVGLNWDGYTHLHPDERFLTIVTTRLDWPSGLLNYLRTSESPLNPYNKGESFYVYGNFPMTVTFFSGQIADSLRTLCPEGADSIWCRSPLSSYDGVHLVGRLLSGLVDLVAVFFTFLLGRRLYGRSAGLIAAFLMATAVMPIQQSHFYTMDNWAAAFCTAALYAAVRASKNAVRLRWWAIFGVMLGLAAASRVNVAPIALMAGVAGMIWLIRRYQQSEAQPRHILHFMRRGEGNIDLQWVLIGGMLAAIVSIAIFRVAMPYAFSDAQIARQTFLEETGIEPSSARVFVQSIIGFNPQWLANLEEIQRLQAPEAVFPPALQWVDRPAIIFPLTNMLLYGLGPLAGLLAWIGFCVALWRIIQAKPEWSMHLLPVAWVGLYFLFIGTRWVKSIRYFLPIYPALFILAGWFLVFLIQRSGVTHDRWREINWRTPRTWAATTLLSLTLVTSLLWANAFVEIYRQPMTRVAASDWMYENIPTAATLIYEANGTTQEQQLPLTGVELGQGVPDIPISFSLPVDGVITGVRFNYVSDSDGQPADQETLRASVGGAFGTGTSVEGVTTVDLTSTRTAVEIPLTPTLIPKEINQTIFLSAGEGGNFRLDTSVLTSEHWDDALPTRVGGRDPFSQYFRGLPDGPMTTTFPDNDPTKIDNLVTWLDQADFVVITSQRSLWSLPRLPLTYPLMIRYYEGLFNGELGYELAAEFHGDIRIGPLHISDTTGQIGWGEPPDVGWPPPGDLAAEEAFSVYDHPPVWIFRKTADFDPAAVRQIFEAVDRSFVVTMNPLEATQAVNGLLLTPEQAVNQQSGGTFREVFNLDGILSNNGILATIVWWLLVIILGWAAFPVSFVIFRGFADRGYALSRILAVLFLSWFSWFGASLGWASFSGRTMWLGAGVLLLLALGLAWKNRRELAAFISQKWRLLLILEGVGVFFFALQLMLRLGNPDVWHVIWGGEKPMDMSYFSAVLKSTTFPPYDPWLAGGYINYYYYGFVFAGVLTKMLKIVPAVAYNLILPMLYSFTGLGVFSLAYNLTAATREKSFQTAVRQGISRAALIAGSAAAVMAVVLGNLRQVGVMITAWVSASNLPADSSWFMRLTSGAWGLLTGTSVVRMYPGDWFWTASRGIIVPQGEVGPITEFPFFTFLYGDLHAHMIALPLAILALGWALALVLNSDGPEGWGTWLLIWFVGALSIGVLYPTNSWDYPTYLVIGLLALIFVNYRRWAAGHDPWFTTIGRIGIQAAALGSLSLLLFWPFWANFGTGYGSIRLWEGSKTAFSDYFSIHGLFLFICLTWLFVDLKSWLADRTTDWLAERAGKTALGVTASFAILPVMIFGFMNGYDVVPVGLIIVLFAGLLSLRRDIDPARCTINALVASAVALSLIVEIVVLDGDIGRMNTVFKFYMQVWILLSIAAGVALGWLWMRLAKSWSLYLKTGWLTVLLLLVSASLLYPLLATRAKWLIRENRESAPITLDGMRYMQYVTYGDQGEIIALDDDYEAIRWMQGNIDGSPIIVEAFSGNPYRSIATRVAMYTGLPTVVGWDWHQRQQRNTVPPSIISRRIEDVNTLYRTTDPQTALSILEKYNVQYIYAGQMEVVYYGLDGVLKFDDMVEQGLLTEVYQNSGVRIYQTTDIRPQTTDDGTS